ncbi:MAG: hypothetical protein PHV11_08830, partial [Candidatus Bipolaricaulis sp.]|nr:hypothetical protein [Candidatus Bipolaricaulis sp.]
MERIIVIGDSLAHVAAEQIKDIIIVAGYDEGKIWCQISNDGGQTSTELVEVGPGDDEQPTIRIMHTGEIVVTLTDG